VRRGQRQAADAGVISSTLLAGEASWFTDDAGTLVQNMDHRGLFAFREADLADPGTLDALAVAARSSMAFPVVFEPAFVAHTEVPGGRRSPAQPAMRKFAERQVRRILLYVVPSAGVGL
jgi:hypothetical protein